MNLEGKHVVITGGTGALGSAVVTTLLEQGALCHVPCLEAARPAHLEGVKGLTATGSVDLLSEDSARDYYASLPKLWASIHLVGGFAMAPILETSAADFVQQFELNTLTCFLCCREAIRSFGGGPGRLVNVGSRPVVQPVGGMSGYSAAKAGVVALSQGLAAEMLSQDVLVNAVLPSIIDTPMNRKAMPDADFADWPTPTQIAKTINFLVSPANELTTGALIPVYGKA